MRALVVADADGVLAAFGPYTDVDADDHFRRLEAWALDAGDETVSVSDVELHHPSTLTLWVTDPDAFYEVLGE